MMILLETLQTKAKELQAQFHLIEEDRKALLQQLAGFIRERSQAGKPVYLNFICTHNSRRSHIAQLWAQAAAAYYDIAGVHCYSGGTEATAFNPRAVAALQEAGFRIDVIKEGSNPLYEVRVTESAQPLQAWSKTFDDAANPKADFCAIMTCSDADENCPFVPGVALRLALTFEDPKKYDDTPQEKQQYQERVDQIGRQILYAFYEVKSSPR